MKNCRKNAQKSSNGITLIALVVTIIVLLILAGISISMLSGDNSILQKATLSKEKTERAEIIETAQMDILAMQAKNHGNLSADELEEILISPDYNTQGTLSSEDSILDRTLTSKDGKYTIPVSQIYNGELAENNSGLNVARLKSKLENSDEDYVQINEKGEISEIVWGWRSINDDECYLMGDPADGDDEPYSYYEGEIIDGKLKDGFPIFIKSSGKIYRVTQIGQSALAQLQIKEINIPEGIVKIGNEAFYSCGQLEKITLPSTLTEIGFNAFFLCRNLENINYPERLKSIGYRAFGECNKLYNVNIPNSIESLGTNVFIDTAWYNSQPNGVIYIGKFADGYKGRMSSNTTIELKEGTEYLAGDYYYGVFDNINNNNALVAVVIPNSIKRIDQYAFQGFNNLTSITINKAKDSISGAPWGAPNMTVNDVDWAD